MKYLNDEIEVTLPIEVSVSDLYNFTVSRTYLSDVLFVGDVYAIPEKQEKLYLNDIIANDYYINKGIIGAPVDLFDTNTPIVDKYSVKIGDNTASTEEIFLGYKYPHKLNRLGEVTPKTICMQSGLIPVYPSVETSQYGIGICSIGEGSITLGANLNGKIGVISNIKAFNNATQYSLLSTILNNEPNYYKFDNLITRISKSSGIVSTSIDDGGTGVSVVLPPPATTVLSKINTIEIAGRDKRGNYLQGDTVVMDESYKDGEKHHVILELKDNDNKPIELTSVYLNIGDTSSTTYKCTCETHTQTKAENALWRVEFDVLITSKDESYGMIVLSGIQFYKALYIEPEENTIVARIADKYQSVIGKFGCNDGYYLQWQDRYGSLQSQHFGGTSKPSNSYERENIVTYKGYKRVSYNDVTTKFEINSGWLDETTYPCYESIFVSPSLRLYDVKEDKSYEVNIEDSTFDEKTFHNNSRQLFNLTLKLTVNKTQNIKL